MTTECDHKVWPQSINTEYDHRVWSQSVTTEYEHRVGPQSMTTVCDHIVWQQSMNTEYDHRVWILEHKQLLYDDCLSLSAHQIIVDQKAHSHKHEITNETFNDKSAQRQMRRQFIHTATSAIRNVDENWRCF